MTRKHKNVSAEYCPNKDTVETIPLSRNRDFGHIAEQKQRKFSTFYGRSDDSHFYHIVISVIVVGGSDIFNWFF